MAKTQSGRPADLDINAQIDRELEIAKTRWGESFELKCLEGSGGDTLSDENPLRTLRYFIEHGTVLFARHHIHLGRSPQPGIRLKCAVRSIMRNRHVRWPG